MAMMLQRAAALAASRPLAPVGWRAMSGVTMDAIKALRSATGAPILQCKNALGHPEVGGDHEAAVKWLREQGIAKVATKSGRSAADGLVAVASSPTKDMAVLVELNSETDFVARNDMFRDLMHNLTTSALAALPAGASGEAALEALKAADTVDVEMGGTVTGADAVLGVAAKMGENLVLRRASSVSAENGVVSTYVHSATHPGQGKIGAAVALGGPGVDLADVAQTDALAAVGERLAMHVAAAQPKYLDESGIPADIVAAEKELLATQVADSGKPPAVVEKIVAGRMGKFYGEVCLTHQACMTDEEGRKVTAYLAARVKEAGLPADVSIQGFACQVVGAER